MSEDPAKRLPQRLGVVLYWVFPAIPFLWLYHRGLWCWFYGDDFSLLLLAAFPDNQFWEALLQPRAQGTFRPLSERLFFYFFHGWFGFDSFPYRVLVFGTQIVNLWLLAAVTNRLTRNRLAGLAAASLWGIHHGLASSMTWTSAYNQVLCAFFFLLSFLLFLRFAESGRKRYYTAQWITFVLGLGSLETMVVYPVVLLGYVLTADRRRWRHAAAMLPGSIAFAWLQLSAAPTASEGVYQTDFGGDRFGRRVLSLHTADVGSGRRSRPCHRAGAGRGGIRCLPGLARSGLGGILPVLVRDHAGTLSALAGSSSRLLSRPPEHRHRDARGLGRVAGFRQEVPASIRSGLAGRGREQGAANDR